MSCSTRLLPFVLAAVAGCADADVCDDIVAELERCDLAQAPGACERAWPTDALMLHQKLEMGGCEALYDNDTGRVSASACSVLGWPCPPPLFDNVASGEAPLHPVVFVGGIDATPAVAWSPRVLDDVAARTDAAVEALPLPSWEDTATRAQALHNGLAVLRARYGAGERFHLICYAVGGVDCRFLASADGLHEADPDAHEDAISLVASITTVSAPHRGTNVADLLLALPPSELFDRVSAALLAGEDLDEHEREQRLRAVLSDITLDTGRDRDLAWRDDPRVYAQSWAAVSNSPQSRFSEDTLDRWCTSSDGTPSFEHHHGRLDAMSLVLTPLAGAAEVAWIGDARGTSPADGLVSVESARWGAFRGCVPADHYDVIGRLNDRGVDPVTGFDAGRFYAEVVRDLAAKGM